MWVAVSTTHGSFNRPRRRRAICERLSDAFGVRVVFPHEYPAFHTGLPTWPPFRGLLPLRPDVKPDSTVFWHKTKPHSQQHNRLAAAFGETPAIPSRGELRLQLRTCPAWSWRRRSRQPN